MPQKVMDEKLRADQRMRNDVIDLLASWNVGWSPATWGACNVAAKRSKFYCLFVNFFHLRCFFLCTHLHSHPIKKISLFFFFLPPTLVKIWKHQARATKNQLGLA